MRRGAEDMHKMTKDTFTVLFHQESGLKYVSKAAVDELAKTHRENDREPGSDAYGNARQPHMPSTIV